MTGVRTVGIALASMMVLSCAPAPVKINAGDHCYRCRRYIMNERVAAETISGEGARFVGKFRGPGCMAKYLADHPDDMTTGTIYVTDYTSGKMMRPDKAHFVTEVVDLNTGEKDYRAYRDETDARAAAQELKSDIVSWQDVLEKAR